MKYLGHQNVAVLRGSQQDWSAAGISLSGATSTIAEAVYIPDPRPELLADYESVASGDFAVVDARAPDQFGAGHIDGAINIDYNRLIEGSWLKDDSALTEIFSDLEKDRTVAVYTKNGGQASIVWYALMLQGRDARLYTWNDWLGHQS
jgi:thiosulfate/3-mercaptopyruvate sulfurtransferase